MLVSYIPPCLETVCGKPPLQEKGAYCLQPGAVWAQTAVFCCRPEISGRGVLCRIINPIRRRADQAGLMLFLGTDQQIQHQSTADMYPLTLSPPWLLVTILWLH